MKRQVIGLVGTPASGKGVIAEYLKDIGFVVYSLSDILRNRLKAEGIKPTRDNMIALGNELRTKYGNDYLAATLKKTIDKTDDKCIVIDSIRNPGEAQFLKENLGAAIVTVTAPQKRSFEFMKKRNRQGDPKTWEEFTKVYDRELGIGQNESGLRLKDCIEKADIVMKNTGTIEDLKEKINNELHSRILKCR